MILTLEQLQARGHYWQGVLRLLDWDVRVRLGRRHQMNTSTSVAQVWISGTTRTAVITLLDPVDFHPDEDPRNADMEDSLVHELLHVHLHDLQIERAEADRPRSHIEIAEERAIEAIGQALLRLDRAREAV